MTSGVLRIIAVSAALTLSGSPAVTFAQQKEKPPAAGSAKDFAIPTPKRVKLSNGMPVTMVPFGQVPKVTIRVVVSAANVHEQKEEVWLADLTGSEPPDAVLDETVEIAADLSGINNLYLTRLKADAKSKPEPVRTP